MQQPTSSSFSPQPTLAVSPAIVALAAGIPQESSEFESESMGGAEPSESELERSEETEYSESESTSAWSGSDFASEPGDNKISDSEPKSEEQPEEAEEEASPIYQEPDSVVKQCFACEMTGQPGKCSLLCTALLPM